MKIFFILAITTLMLLSGCIRHGNEKVNDKPLFYGLSIYSGEGTMDFIYFKKKGETVTDMNSYNSLYYYDFDESMFGGVPDSIYNGLLDVLGSTDSVIVPISNVRKTRQLLSLLKMENRDTINIEQNKMEGGIYTISYLTNDGHRTKIIGKFDSNNNYSGNITIEDTTGFYSPTVLNVMISPVTDE